MRASDCFPSKLVTAIDMIKSIPRPLEMPPQACMINMIRKVSLYICSDTCCSNSRLSICEAKIQIKDKMRNARQTHEYSARFTMFSRGDWSTKLWLKNMAANPRR